VLTTGAAAPVSGSGGFTGDITISPAGAISANNLDDDRVYEVAIQVTQGSTNFTETFSVITGTNAANNVDGTYASGDDVIFSRGDNDTVLAGSGNDYVFGQQGNDNIYGGAGNDVLNGAGGDDVFWFDTALNAATNNDVIQDFSNGGGNGNDTIRLDDAIFVGLVNAGGVLSSAQLSTTGVATASTAQVIYNASTGALYFDQDGTGSAYTAVQFAVLGDTTHPTAASITTADFIIY